MSLHTCYRSRFTCLLFIVNVGRDGRETRDSELFGARRLHSVLASGNHRALVISHKLTIAASQVRFPPACSAAPALCALIDRRNVVSAAPVGCPPLYGGAAGIPRPKHASATAHVQYPHPPHSHPPGPLVHSPSSFSCSRSGRRPSLTRGCTSRQRPPSPPSTSLCRTPLMIGLGGGWMWCCQKHRPPRPLPLDPPLAVLACPAR